MIWEDAECLKCLKKPNGVKHGHKLLITESFQPWRVGGNLIVGPQPNSPLSETTNSLMQHMEMKIEDHQDWSILNVHHYIFVDENQSLPVCSTRKWCHKHLGAALRLGIPTSSRVKGRKYRPNEGTSTLQKPCLKRLNSFQEVKKEILTFQVQHVSYMFIPT